VAGGLMHRERANFPYGVEVWLVEEAAKKEKASSKAEALNHNISLVLSDKQETNQERRKNY
jgi:hypothetical protein